MPDALRQLKRHPVPPGLTDGITGWLLPREEHALHALGLLADGPILEIGSWCGRSTVCLATGIAARPIPVDFVTVELDPKIEQWPVIDGERYFRPSLDEDVLHGVGPGWDTEIAPVINGPGGVLGALTANLAAAGVADLVEVLTGDFRAIDLPHDSYGLVFADVMHDEVEITRNAEHLTRLVRPGGLLACHDTTPENRELLERWFRFSATAQVDSLFVGAVLQ